MDRFPSTTVSENASRTRDLTFAEQQAGDLSIDFLLGARVDAAWILSKFGTQFDNQVLQNLKKAVYAIGQGGRRWFSGGGELSERQASTILDYLVLVELLLQCRDDLRQHRQDLLDCRDQLVMQVNRYTEGQPERIAALVNVLVHRFKQQQLADESAALKPR
jgi:hypothetical protein